MSESRYLGRRQLRGLDKLGDAYLPADADLPSFSETGCRADVDAVLDHLPEQDRSDLGLLLTVLGWLPFVLVRMLVGLLARSGRLPGAPGALVRFARVGTRGLVLSLYWGHPVVLDAIGYEVGVVPGRAGEPYGNVAPSPR